jgi:hypothetical protein
MALTVTKLQVAPLPGAIVRTLRLGEAASAGQAVYPNASSAYLKADADAAGKFRGVAVLIVDNQGQYNTTGDYASGDDVSAVVFGPVAGFSGMDPTKSVWVDTTAGGFTQTKPAGGGIFASPIGYPLSDSVLMINPQPFDTTY